MRNEVIHCPYEAMHWGNRMRLSWSRLRLSFSFLIKVRNVARIGMTGRSNVVNGLEENLSGIRIAPLGDVFLSQIVPWFIVSQINSNKGVDLIGRLDWKRRISPNSPMIEVAVVSAIPGMERRISYSGRGLASSTILSKIVWSAFGQSLEFSCIVTNLFDHWRGFLGSTIRLFG